MKTEYSRVVAYRGKEIVYQDLLVDFDRGKIASGMREGDRLLQFTCVPRGDIITVYRMVLRKQGNGLVSVPGQDSHLSLPKSVIRQLVEMVETLPATPYCFRA